MRNTKQKEFVLSLLQKRYDHPTAQDIQDQSLQEGVKIGRASIYRILSDMVSAGQVRKLLTKDNVAHYDFYRPNHVHIVCKNCGKIFDLPSEKIFLQDFKQNLGGFEIEEQEVELFGLCKECKTKNASI